MTANGRRAVKLLGLHQLHHTNRQGELLLVSLNFRRLELHRLSSDVLQEVFSHLTRRDCPLLSLVLFFFYWSLCYRHTNYQTCKKFREVAKVMTLLDLWARPWTLWISEHIMVDDRDLMRCVSFDELDTVTSILGRLSWAPPVAVLRYYDTDLGGKFNSAFFFHTFLR